ncbi:MAG: hypothetical protein LBJ00_11245 [Planctomycetaceae bacterium]|nr:hypothetical protein [Planctomycetaceae bacterium]
MKRLFRGEAYHSYRLLYNLILLKYTLHTLIEGKNDKYKLCVKIVVVSRLRLRVVVLRGRSKKNQTKRKKSRDVYMKFTSEWKFFCLLFPVYLLWLVFFIWRMIFYFLIRRGLRY